MATSFNSFSNPQQLASYQQTQPGSTPQQPKPQPLVQSVKPTGPEEDEDLFTRLQRTQGGAAQTSGSSQQTAPTSAPTAAGAVSPVSSNGRLTTAPAQVAQPQQVTAPPLQAAQPATPDPFQAMGGGVQLPGGGWVPRDHPLAAQAGAQPGAAPGAAQGPAQPYAGYQAAPTRPGNTAYGGTDINVDLPNAHQAQNFTQWQGFDEGTQGALQQGLIEQILRNPRTMTDTAVAQLKEKQKESASSIRDQAMGAADSRAAARGVLGGAGNTAANRGIASDFGEHLLGSYRDIDLERIERDRADELGALEASDALMQSRFGRANEGYRNTLAGQTAQEDANQFQSDFGLRRGALDLDVQNARAGDARAVSDSALQNYRADQDSWNSDQDRLFNTFDGNANRVVDNRRIDVQDKLGTGGLALDRDRLTEDGRQFDANNRLNFLNYLQRGSQFNDSNALDWERLNSDNTYRWLGML